MKKRIIGILLIVVIVVSALSGCLAVNTERDMKQVVATVNYKGMTATVSKLEVLEVYAQNVQTYVQYYGMSEREVFDYFLNQLSVRKLLVLDAADRELCEWDNANMKIVASSLSYAQLNEAQDSVNTQLKELFDEYVETVTEEYTTDEDAESGTSGTESGTEGEDEDSRTVRPLPAKDEEEKEYSDDKVDVESWMQNFEYADNIERIAFKRLEKLLEDQYKDEEYLLQSQYQTLVIKQLQETLYSSIEITDSQILAKFKADREKQIEEFDNVEGSYGKAISGNQVVYYHKPKTEDGATKYYGTVKHILLSFEDATKGADLDDEIKHIYFADSDEYSLTEYDARKESKLYTDAQLKAYRTALVENLKIGACGDFADWWTENKDEDNSELIDWRDTKYEAGTTPKTAREFFAEVSGAVSAKTTEKDKIAKFVDYIFGYNSASETGMFNNENDYVVEPEGTKYMKEFQVLSEYLISGTTIPSDYAEYCGATEHGKIGDIGVCVTDYGVHIVMVTNIFKDDLYLAAYESDSVDSLKAITINWENGDNLYDYIKESLESAEKNNVMTSYQSNFIDIYGEESITLNNGVIDDMFKE